MTRSILLVAASGLAVCVAGCSALGLDRFDFPDCETGCNTLNDRDTIAWDPGTGRPTECLAWRCDQSSGECRFGAPDDDRDGHYSSLLCASEEGVEPADDCDDTDPTLVPGGTELCNGRDDDCNGTTDDVFTAALGATVDVMPISGGMPPTWVRSTALAPTGIAVSWANGAEAGFAQLRDTSAPTAPGAPLAPFAQTADALEWDAFGRDREVPIARGCANGTFSPSPRRTACVIDADCGDPSEVCVQEQGGARKFCETALSYPSGYPTDGSLCLHDADCGDTTFCNGDHACAPSDSAVDARQCRAQVIPACAGTSEACDEERMGCVTRVPGGCTAESVAFTSGTDDHWIAAFVTESGCDDGALRLGYFLDEDRADPVRYPNRNILQRGDERRSTAFLGVDVGDSDRDSRCTGATRPPGAPIGVSGVVSASLAPTGDRRVPQALVAYFAAPHCREVGGCAADVVGATGPVDVEVIGAWLENGTTGASSAPIAWVNATGDGVPSRLGAAALGIGPALASFEGESGGYVLAYADAGGAIAIHVIDRIADPSPLCTSGGPRPCIRPDGTTDVGTALTATPIRTTAPLTVPAATAIFDGATPVGSVAMALGAPNADGELPIGLAWPEADQIAMAVAFLDPAAGTIRADGAITRHDAAELDLRSLSMAYVSTGIGTTPGGVPGGFVAAWAAGTSTWAARLDLEGDSVAPGRVRLGTATKFPRAFVEHVEQRDDEGNVLRTADIVRVLGATPTTFVTFPGVCGTES